PCAGSSYSWDRYPRKSVRRWNVYSTQKVYMRRRFSCSQSRMKLSLRVFNSSSSTLTLERNGSFIYAARITTIRSKARWWRICIKRSTGCYQENNSIDGSAREISKIDNHVFESAHH